MVNQRSRELRMCALLLTVSFLALPSFAAGKRWSSKGQPGPGVTALVMSRSNPSLLYVGTYGGGVFRSLDAAESWQAINAGITNFRILSLAMDPVVPVTLYAGTDSGQLFSTIDGGENWKKMPAFTDQRIGAIVVAAEGRTIYVLTHGSIFRSSDGGENWTETRNGLDGNVEALSTATSVPSKLFAGTATGLFTTSDRGDSWSRVPIPGVGQVGGLAVSDDGQTIYVNSGDFNTSTDGGRTWNRVPGNGVRSSNAMAIDRSSNSTAWATTYDRGGRTHSVYRTTDRGTTWQRLDFVDDVRSLLLDGDTVYAGTSSGVYKTIDAAGGWTLRNSGLNAGSVSEVVVDAANPKYTATTHSSPWTAQTFGEWSAPVNVGPPINTIYNDNYAVLSRDELTMYFTSDRPGSLGRDDLWFATRESVDSPWREPQNMGALINGPYTDSLPFLSSNEHVLYFYSTRPAGSCGAPGPGDIWMTRRRNKQSDWEEPINLGCVLNTSADEIAPAFFEDPETEQAWLFYGSNRPGSADYDVYASPLGEDGLAGPGILVPEFSSPGRDTRIFIRKDGLEAFITSNRATGGQGGIDIWTSTRQTVSDAWSVPTNLGIPVDSSSNDGSPWLSKDGTTLYFFSDRPGNGSLGKRDIWYTTRVKLND